MKNLEMPALFFSAAFMADLPGSRASCRTAREKIFVISWNPEIKFGVTFSYLAIGTSAAPAGTHLPLYFTNIRRTFASARTEMFPFSSAALKTV